MIQLHYNEGEQQELFPLIDEEGRVVGRATRKYCHGGSMALHPVVHLHVLDADGRLYLQKRSMKKDIAPGKWDTSVGGHVDYGESLADAVVREASEELGLHIVADDCRFLFQYIWQSSRERELVTAFCIVADDDVVPQPDHDEVDEGRYFTIEELRSHIGQEYFTQQFENEELAHLLNTLGDSKKLIEKKSQILNNSHSQ